MTDQIEQTTNNSPAPTQQPQGHSGLKIFGIVVVACLISQPVARYALFGILGRVVVEPAKVQGSALGLGFGC